MEESYKAKLLLLITIIFSSCNSDHDQQTVTEGIYFEKAATGWRVKAPGGFTRDECRFTVVQFRSPESEEWVPEFDSKGQVINLKDGYYLDDSYRIQEFDSCDFLHDVPLNDTEFFFQGSYYVYFGEKDHEGTAVPQYKLSPAIRNLVTLTYKNTAGEKLTADLEIWAETAD